MVNAGLGAIGGPLRYLPRCAKALCRGALEIWISPSKGRSISKDQEIEPQQLIAQTNRTPTTVVLEGEKRPKLANSIASQKTSTTRNGIGIDPPVCSSRSDRSRVRWRGTRHGSTKVWFDNGSAAASACAIAAIQPVTPPIFMMSTIARSDAPAAMAFAIP